MHGVLCHLCDVGPPFLTQRPAVGGRWCSAPFCTVWQEPRLLTEQRGPGAHVPWGPRRPERWQTGTGVSPGGGSAHPYGGQIYHGTLQSAANVMKTIVF